MALMSDEIVCPNCSSDEHLSGERRGDLIRLTCSACELVWDRDPSPSCPTCGNRDVRPVPQAVWEKARGSQLSIVSLNTVYLCPDCDSQRLRRFILSGTPLPPDDNPAEGMR
jgi:ribosomal protein L37AE/L43A